MERPDVPVAIVGAGPYGLSAAIHLGRAGVQATVFGRPMSFWRSMPKGMLLRSNWSASSMVDRVGPHSLDAFKAATGAEFGQPVPLESFVDYGLWVQRTAVPDVDERAVTRVSRTGHRFAVELADGESVSAGAVVVAGGIAPFAYRPPEFDELPAERAVHSSEVPDPSDYAGEHVAVVGGGQSSLETAALISAAGGFPEVIVRSERVVWLRGHAVIHRLGRLGPVVYAPTDVGPLWYSRLVSQPSLFTLLPRDLQDRIARRCIRPAGSHWVREALTGTPITLGRGVRSAGLADGKVELELDDGSHRRVDRVVLGTGYRVDVTRYGFLAPELAAGVRQTNGYPHLRSGLESSVPGLHFLGAPAARSVGPIMRFVSGTWFAGRALAARLGR